MAGAECKEMGNRREIVRTTICIGDIHGFYEKLERLWNNLEAHVGTSIFSKATIIFLGDYCDRGPDTARVLQFLVSLPSRYPSQKHVFLCGNHDFAFAAFLGVLPPPPPGFSFRETWQEFAQSEDREGWWKGEGYDEMHVQGRRWAGNIRDRFNPKKGMDYKGSIYDARPTFESYGVPHGHADLIKVVPENQKKLLQDLVWVHEEDEVYTGDPETSCTKLIAVHAGLEKTKGVEEQLKVLYSRDVRIPKVEALSGRKNVWDIPMTTLHLNCPPNLITSAPMRPLTVTHSLQTHPLTVSSPTLTPMPAPSPPPPAAAVTLGTMAPQPVDVSEVGIGRMTTLVKPSFFVPPPLSSTLVPLSISSTPTAPPLHPPAHLQPSHGAPRLQPFPTPSPPASLTSASSMAHGPIITRDGIRDALIKLVQNEHFIDMVYREMMNAHLS